MLGDCAIGVSAFERFGSRVAAGRGQVETVGKGCEKRYGGELEDCLRKHRADPSLI